MQLKRTITKFKRLSKSLSFNFYVYLFNTIKYHVFMWADCSIIFYSQKSHGVRNCVFGILIIISR